MTDPQIPDEEEDLLARTSVQRGPLLWFALLAIPFVIAITVSLSNATREESVIIPEGSQAEVSTSATAENMVPGYDLKIKAARRLKRVQRGAASSEIFCPDKALTGEAYTPETEAMLKASKRPYRIIDNLKMYRNDYVAERINLHLGANGTIQSVWCG